MRIKVMADYGCSPLWWDNEPGRMGDIDPSHLAITQDLLAALTAWASRFDAILNIDDPVRSDFVSPAAEKQFHADGRGLATRLAEELGPSFKVRYWHD